MADFLSRLAARTLGIVPTVQPKVAPRFAPVPALAGNYSLGPFAEDGILEDSIPQSLTHLQDRETGAPELMLLPPPLVPQRKRPLAPTGRMSYTLPDTQSAQQNRGVFSPAAPEPVGFIAGISPAMNDDLEAVDSIADASMPMNEQLQHHHNRGAARIDPGRFAPEEETPALGLEDAHSSRLDSLSMGTLVPRSGHRAASDAAGTWETGSVEVDILPGRSNSPQKNKRQSRPLPGTQPSSPERPERASLSYTSPDQYREGSSSDRPVPVGRNHSMPVDHMMAPSRLDAPEAATGRVDDILVDHMMAPGRLDAPYHHAVAVHLERNVGEKFLESGETEQPDLPTPTIQVTIGRIEVRATPPPSSQPKNQRPTPPVMGLEQYLQQRGRGGGR